MEVKQLLKTFFSKASPKILALLLLESLVFFGFGFLAFFQVANNTLKKTATEQCLFDLKAFAGHLSGTTKDLRVTLINKEGVVTKDNLTDKDTLENHKTRPEIATALKGSQGYAIRKSTVTGTDFLYYATPFEKETPVDKELDKEALNKAGEDAVLRLSVPLSSNVYFSRSLAKALLKSGFVIFAVVFVLSFVLFSFIFFCFCYIKQFALEHVQKTEQIRKDFVSNVSHELKTPITSIIGFAETLEDCDLKKEEKHFAKIIHAQATRLKDIIDDLLTLSRLEKDALPPECLKTNITEFVAGVAKSFEKHFAKKNIKLHFYSAVGNSFCMINRSLFYHALCNIFDNALKYCYSGGVDKGAGVGVVDCSLSFVPQSQEAKTGQVQITIQDTGPGIKDSQKERIFERFYRADKGRARDAGGTGLGLSIAKHIVMIHSGTITAKDRPDGKNGTCFVITLPCYKD